MELRLNIDRSRCSMYLIPISIFFGLIVVFTSGQVNADEYDVNGICPADFEMPRSEELFTIVGKPVLYIGAFDDTEMDLSVSEVIPMHSNLRQITDEGERVEIVSRKKLLDGRRICAWISKEDILSKEVQPLKVETPVDWLDPITGKTETLPNPLALKALLRSNPEFGSEDATQVAIYDKPNITSEQRTNASVFGIYFVYAERETDNGFWYWIAGEDPWYPTKFSGWIPDHHVLLWESQLSLYFNGVEENAGIYASRDQAATGDSTGILGRRPDAYKERSIGVVTDEAQSINIPRFPILHEEQSSSGRGQSIYRIGFFGDDKNKGTIQPGSEDESSKRAKFQQSVKNVDILFLIDNTLSMTEYFYSVVQAVQNSSEQINRINDENGYDIKVKFAAATYGDYLDDSADLNTAQFEIVSRLGRPGNTSHLDKLTKIAETPNSHYPDALGDRPEAGLAGIVLAIDELQWTSSALFKVIVWIGDHGSREVGDKELLSIADVKQSIMDSNVFLLPINVSGRYDPEWNSQFIRQGDQISDEGRGLRTKLAHDGGQSDDYDQAQSYIERSIGAMYTSSLIANLSLRDQTGVSELIDERPELLNLGIPAAESDVRTISQSICQMAFGSKGCQTIQKEGQFMGEGFVRFDERYKNYSFWVNLRGQQLELLQTVLSNTCKGFERGNVKKYVENAMTLVQNSMGGERYRSDIPIGEFLRRFFLLPRGHFPSFLESTPDRIDEAWQQARDLDSDNGDLSQTTAIADPICRSATLLDLVLKNKRVADSSSDIVRTTSITGEETYTWSVKEENSLIEFDWEWAQGGENNYFYIPVEFLPGRVPVN